MKRLIFLFIISATLLSCSRDLGIGRNDVFLKYYSWGLNTIGSDFQQTSDNGYAVSATIYYRDDSTQMCLFKTDEYGNLSWVMKTQSVPNSMSASVAKDAQGNLYALGSFAKSESNTDLIVSCYKQTGEIIWTKTYGSSANETAKDIIVSSDGSVMVLATTDAKNPGNQNPKGKTDILLMKVRANSDSVWSRVYGGNDADNAASIVEKIDHDGFLIIGSTLSFSDIDQAGSNILLISTNIAGAEINKRTFGGMGADEGVQVVMPDSHNIFLTGTIVDANQSYLALINTAEDIQIEKMKKLIPGTQTDVAQSLVLNADGTIAILGTSKRFADGSANALLTKVSDKGEPIFFRHYGSSGTEEGKLVRVPSSGDGYIMLFNSKVDKGSVVSLIRTDSEGTLKTN